MEGIGAGILVSFVALLITALGMKKKSDDTYVEALKTRADLAEETAEREALKSARLQAALDSAIEREHLANRQIARLWRENDELRRG